MAGAAGSALSATGRTALQCPSTSRPRAPTPSLCLPGLPFVERDKHPRHVCRVLAGDDQVPSTTGSSVAARAASTLQDQHAPAAGAPVAEDVLIELRNVHKAFGSKKILRGASFKIRRGEAVGIIGGSGTGKSTTLKLAAGLLAPDSGDVVIKGRPRQGLLADDADSQHSLKIGLVFQSAALFDSLTVGENVGFLLYEHSKLPEEEIVRRVKDSLAKVGLRDVEHQSPASLSGGMKKRVALARAVIPDEDVSSGVDQVIMYDEPTAGLDPVASTVVEDLMRDLHNNRESTIASYIVVTHQHSTIRRATDRLVFLHEGRVVWEGPTPEFDRTDNPYVVQFREGLLEGPLKYV